MNPNTYLLEKLSEAHQQELQLAAEKERLLAQLPRHRRSISKYMAGKLGMLLLWLGVRLKQLEQKNACYYPESSIR